MNKESLTKAKKTEKTVPSKEKEVKPIQAEKGESGGKTAARDTALKNTLAQIEKQYGKGSIMQMDENQYAKIEGIPMRCSPKISPCLVRGFQIRLV